MSLACDASAGATCCGACVANGLSTLCVYACCACAAGIACTGMQVLGQVSGQLQTAMIGLVVALDSILVTTPARCVPAACRDCARPGILGCGRGPGTAKQLRTCGVPSQRREAADGASHSLWQHSLRVCAVCSRCVLVAFMGSAFCTR